MKVFKQTPKHDGRELKILVIGTTDYLGGAAGLGWALGKGLAKRGFDIKYIVGYKKSHSKNVYQLKKNKLISFFESKTRFNIVSLLRSIRAFLLANDIDFGASKEILEHPWYKNADIVQCHNLHGNYFKFQTLGTIASQKPTVLILQDCWALTAHCSHCLSCKNYNNGNHFTPGLKGYGSILWNNANYLWNKKKAVYKKSKKLNIVVPSMWLERKVETSILKHKPLTIISNGIDINIFKPRNKNKIRKELKLPLKKKIIMYVGQGGAIDPRKGGLYFLQLANRLVTESEIVFLCVGGTIEEKPVIKDNIVYIPQINDKETMSKYYNSADVLLVASLAESFSLVTAEALASGLPVVSFDVGALKELVEHKVNGYIAKYKDIEDLLFGLKYILSLDSKSLRKMGLINRKKAVNKYSLNKMIINYVKLYKRLTNINI